MTRVVELAAQKAERLAALPKWAQEHIQTLERERHLAIETLNEFVYDQTPSGIWIEKHVCLGEKGVASTKKSYIQDDVVYVKAGDTVYYIHPQEKSSSNLTPHLYVSAQHKGIIVKPQASNCINVMSED